MKTNKLLRLLLVSISLCILNSCSSDDSTDERQNEIKVNSKSFVISNATLIEESTYNNVTEFQLYLVSSGVTVNADNSINGSGDILALTLFSSQQSALEEGVYLYNDQDNTGLLLNRGSHFFGYDATLGDSQSGNLDIESGSITVEVENSLFIITVNLTDELGDIVSGYYKGIITNFN